MAQQKLYTEEQVRKAIELARLIQEKGSVEDSFDVESISGLTEICTYGWSERYSTDEISEQLIPIELPSDEEIESKYNKFIDDEIQLGFLKQEQGERLKWYYKTYFIDKIQGGNK